MAQGEVSVKIGADASEYIGAIQSSKQAIADFAKANSISLSEARAAISAWTRDQAAATQAAAKEWASVEKQQKQAMAEMAKAAKEQGATIDAAMGAAFTAAKVAVAAAAAAFVAAAGALYDFTSAAVDAANLMDPKGAREWATSTLALNDAWVTFAGTVGEAVRPELEEVIQDLIDLIHWADTLGAGEELKEWFDAAIDSAKDLVAAIKGVGTAMDAFDKANQKAGLWDLGKKIDNAFGMGDQNNWDISAQKQQTVKQVPLGPEAPTNDQHYNNAAEITAAAQVQMRAFREQMKAFADQKEATDAALKSSENLANVQKESAKEVYDLSHKTYLEKETMDRATQSADAQHLVQLQKALDQAKQQTTEFKSHNTLMSPGELAATEARAASPVEMQPAMAETRARDMAAIKDQTMKEQALKQLMQQQDQLQQQVDAAHVQRMKDGAALAVDQQEQQEQNDRAGASAQMEAAQFTFDMSNQTHADEMTLLAAKIENAEAISKLAKGDAAQQKALLDEAAAKHAQQVSENQQQRHEAQQSADANVAAAQFKSHMSGDGFMGAIAVAQAQLQADKDTAKYAQDRAASTAKILADERAIAEIKHDHQQKMADGAIAGGASAAGPLSGAIQTAATGDLPAAAVQAMTAMITASSSFKLLQSSLAPLIQVVADVVGVFGILDGPLLPLIIALQVLGTLFTAVSNGIQSLINGVMAPFKMLGEVVGSIATAFSGVLNALNPLVALQTVFQPLVTAIQQALSGAGGGITQGLEQFGKLISFIGQSFTRATQIFNPVAQVFETFIQAISASFGPIIGKLGNAMTEVASIFETALMPVLPVIESLFSQFATMLSGPLGSAMATVFNAGIQFSAAVLHLAGAFLQAVSSAVDGINTILNDVMNATGGKNGVFGGLYDTVKDLIGVTNTLAAGSQAAFDASNALNQVTWNSVSAQIDLAASTNALNTQLTNLPASFNVAQAYNQAIAAGGLLVGATALTQPLQVGQNTSNPGGPMTATSGGTYGGGYLNNANDEGNREDSRVSVRHGQLGGSDGSGMTVIIEGDLTVSANNPNELAQQLASLSASRGNSRTIAPTNRGVKMNSTLR